MRILSTIIFSFGFLVSAGMSASAVAAPQILGVSAFYKPIPLNCEGESCTAQLASFCLQKRRDDPNPGDAYTIHNKDRVLLHLAASDGRTWTVPADPYVSITAERSFTAVKVEMTKQSLAALGATRVGISVAEGVSLVPVPVAGDPDPITARELAYVTRTLRTKADRWVSGINSKPAAIRIINRLVNATPKAGKMEASARRSMFSDVIGRDRASGLNEGSRRAVEMFGACLYRVEVGRYRSMRTCLQVKQDSLMLDMNTHYWQSIDAGS